MTSPWEIVGLASQTCSLVLLRSESPENVPSLALVLAHLGHPTLTAKR